MSAKVHNDVPPKGPGSLSHFQSTSVHQLIKKKEWREEKGRILSLGASGIHQETHMQKFRQAMFSPPIGVEGKVGPG